MAAPDATRVDIPAAAPLAANCRQKNHSLCKAAQAHCGCPCHGPGGQHPPGARLVAVKAPQILAERLDAFEARLPAHLLNEWKALRRELTGSAPAAGYSNPARIKASNRARFAVKNPAPGMRRCTRCGPKPVAEFAVMNKAGRLRSLCKECHAEYKRSRYIRVGQKAVDIELLDGDELVGQLCPGCHTPFFVGERVVAGHVCHKGCET